MSLPLKYNIRNLFVRKVATVMTVLSIALVVAVFLALMSLATGIDKTFTSSGDARNLIVLRKSAQVETNSVVTKEEYNIIRYLPGIDGGSNGQPLASPELIVLLNQQRRDQPGGANLIVRGVGPEAFELRPQLRVTEGRLFRTGFREMIVSRNIASRFTHAGVGQQLKFGKGMWTVVGHFEASGTAFDSEMWVDVNELISEFNRRGYSSLLFRCRDGKVRQDLIRQIGDDRRLQNEALTEREYYDRQTVSAIGIKTLAIVMTLFMGIGACFAAANTMYSAVSNRTREIGTLRAIGFSQWSILLSFLIEAALIAIIGGAVGCLLALPINGITTGTSNLTTFSEITFNFKITLPLMVSAMILSGFLGVLGGFFPARTAAKQAIIEALRAQ